MRSIISSVYAFAKADTYIHLFSNLQSDTIVIKEELVKAEDYIVRVYTSSGQLVKMTQGIIERGLLETTLSTSAWSKGVYLINFERKHEPH